MDTIGITIRRKNRTDKKLLNKEILTLHKKLKKKDEIITYFSTEKETTNGKYHSHLLIKYNNEYNLYNQLNRFIGGNGWITKDSGLETKRINNGKWGEIYTHQIWDENGFLGYINKHDLTQTLI